MSKYYWACITKSDRIRVKRFHSLLGISEAQMKLTAQSPYVKDWLQPYPANNRTHAEEIAGKIFVLREFRREINEQE